MLRKRTFLPSSSLARPALTWLMMAMRVTPSSRRTPFLSGLRGPRGRIAKRRTLVLGSFSRIMLHDLGIGREDLLGSVGGGVIGADQEDDYLGVDAVEFAVLDAPDDMVGQVAADPEIGGLVFSIGALPHTSGAPRGTLIGDGVAQEQEADGAGLGAVEEGLVQLLKASLVARRTWPRRVEASRAGRGETDWREWARSAPPREHGGAAAMARTRDGSEIAGVTVHVRTELLRQVLLRGGGGGMQEKLDAFLPPAGIERMIGGIVDHVVAEARGLEAAILSRLR